MAVERTNSIEFIRDRDRFIALSEAQAFYFILFTRIYNTSKNSLDPQ